MNERLIVGLDIGTTKVCAVVGKENEYGKVNILGLGKCEFDGVRKGEVVNIDKTTSAIQKAVQEASTHANANIYSVVVGIGGDNIRSMQKNSIITLSSVNQQITQSDINRLTEEIYKIATPPGTEIIHALPQEYSVDNHIGVKDPIGMSGVRLECNYHVVTASSSSIRNIETCVNKAGYEIDDIVLQPLASAAAVLNDEEMEAGVCVIDIGGGTTDLAIYYDNIIRHTAVIPFGGNIITEDIRRGCSIMQRQAEILKTRYGSALPEEEAPDEIITIGGIRDRPSKEISKFTLSKIIQSRVEEFAEFILKEIHAAGFFKNLVGGIVITGGGAELSKISELIAYVTGTETRIGYPTEHLALGMVGEVNNPMYATVTGLIIHNIKNPNSFKQRRLKEKATPIIMEQTANKSKIIDRVKVYFDSIIRNTNPIE